MNDASTITVTVRRRWNDPRSARVPLAALRELVHRNDPGGVCGPIARPFPAAKPYFLIDDGIDDPETLAQLVRLTVRELPMPKPKLAKKPKAAKRPKNERGR